MLIHFLIVIISLALLVFAADILINGVSALANLLNIPPIIIGLTLVSLGTSLPEIIVSIKAVQNNDSTLALANIIGSNISNILLVGGVASLVYPLSCVKNNYSKPVFFMLLATIIFAILAYVFGKIGFFAGILLVTLAIIISIYVSLSTKSTNISKEKVENNTFDRFIYKYIKWHPHIISPLLYIIFGITLLPLSADTLVKEAIIIAKLFGVSSTFIGLTVLAFGTSLPELITSIIAAKKKHCDIALGSILGSNFYNISLVAGLSAMFGDISFIKQNLIFDLPVLFILTIIFATLLLFTKVIGRKIGICAIFCYITYLSAVYFI